MNEAYIIACARSAVTKADKGGFAFTRIDDVGATVIKALLARMPSLDVNSIEQLFVGCAQQEGEQGLNIARNLVFLSGLPLSIGAITLNRLCASSLDCVNLATQAIWCGNAEAVIAGGLESMSHVPMGGFNPSHNECISSGRQTDAYISMGLTAENIAKEFSVSRQEQDRFALMSHRKAVSAHEQGRFASELVPCEAVTKDGGRAVVARDEGPRIDTSLKALSQLSPAFLKNGAVTAGNSSQRSDGAAFVLLASKKMAKKLGARPLGAVRGFASAGVEPELMGKGPIIAVPKALANAGVKQKAVRLYEINEAFAAQTLASIKALGLDEKTVNVNGGAIAIGHPLGMSGARIVMSLINAMAERDASTGVAAMCVGGGQGVATVVERS